MIFLLSPAKTLDFSESDRAAHTQPRLLEHSRRLIDILREKTVPELQRLMDISEDLAVLNAERYADYRTPFTPDNAKQALLAFKGDVYQGLGADDFDGDDLDYAQQHLRILSGLYGLLRPLDLMQPYRLEMGTRLSNGHGKNLYEFWGGRITELINRDLRDRQLKAVVNLASQEYFKAVDTDGLEGALYDIDFKEKREDGSYRIIAFYAKRARGMMCRYAVRNRLREPAQLRDFDMDGYAFNEALSDERHFVFTR